MLKLVLHCWFGLYIRIWRCLNVHDLDIYLYPLRYTIYASTMSSAHNYNYRVAKTAQRTPTCDTCKSRHQKCSGEKPQCSNCKLRGIDCAYSATRTITRVPESSRSPETTFAAPFVSSPIHSHSFRFLAWLDLANRSLHLDSVGRLFLTLPMIAFTQRYLATSYVAFIPFHSKYQHH